MTLIHPDQVKLKYFKYKKNQAELEVTVTCFFISRAKSSQELDVEESEIAANYAAITAYNGPLR